MCTVREMKKGGVGKWRCKHDGTWKDDVAAAAVPEGAVVEEGVKDAPAVCWVPMLLGMWCAKLQRSPYVQNPVVAQLRQTLWQCRQT